MKNRTTLIILQVNILSFISFPTLFAQSPFKAGVTVGLNLTQIDGDHQSGYDHKGASFGLRGGFAVNPQLDIMSELLYLEKGAEPGDASSKYEQKAAVIRLKYAEVPLTLNYHLKKNEDGFYQWTFHTGISYGRLLKSTATVTQRFRLDTAVTKSLSQEFFKKEDISFIIGLSYNIRSNFGLRFRNSFALNKMFVNLNPERSSNGVIKRDAYLTFRNYFISIQGFYDFIAPKYKQNKKKQPARSK